MSKVNFFCIGAGKAGTTWLWSLLNQHPEIMLPKIKEMHYFNTQSFEDPEMLNPISKQNLEWYHKHFDFDDDILCGDFTPCYIWDRDAVKKIHRYNPNAKIIAILRNPFERTFSQYKFAVNQGRIPEIDFSEAIENYEFLTRESLYANDLKKTQEIFGKHNVLVLNFDDLIKDTERVLKVVEEFLCIKEYKFNVGLAVENSGGSPKHKKLIRLLTKTRIFLKKYQLLKLYLFLRNIGGSKISKFLRKPTKNKKNEVKTDIKYNEVLNQKFNRDLDILKLYVDYDISNWYGKLNEKN